MYAGRLLTIGLLGGSVLQAGPPPFVAPAAPAVNAHVTPQIVTGDAPPFAAGDVLSAAPPSPAAAAPATISHEVVEPQLVAGEAPPFPSGDAIRPNPEPEHGGRVLLFADNFRTVDDSPTDERLAAGAGPRPQHVPNTAGGFRTSIGTSWSEENTAAGSHQKCGGPAFFLCNASAGVATELHIYTFQPSPSSLNIELFTQFADVAVNPADPWFFVARYTDKDNYYSAGTYRAADLNDKRIFKKVASVVTELASGDEGTPATATLGFNLTDAVKALQLNGVDVLTTADNVLTSIGRAGFGLGNAWTAGDSIDVGWALQQFECRQDFPPPGPDTRSSVKSKLPQLVTGEAPAFPAGAVFQTAVPGPVGQVLIFDDTFTGAAGIQERLAAGIGNKPTHTVGPIGLGWSTEKSALNISAQIIVADSGNVRASSTGLNQSHKYSFQPLPTNLNIELFVELQTTTTNATAPWYFLARFTDNQNYYSAGTYGSLAAADKKIFKRDAGVDTELASGDEGLADGDTLGFILTDALKTLQHNGADVLTTADNALTSIGRAGFGLGANWVSTDDINSFHRPTRFTCKQDPPGPGDDTRSSVKSKLPQLVAGDGPPTLPAGDVLSAAPPSPAAAAPATISHEVLEPQIVRGQEPPLPVGDVLPSAALAPAAPTFNQRALVAQFVAGDAPPFPVGDVLAAGGHPPVVTFNQHVEPQIVRGQEPPFPVGDVLSAAPVGPAVAFNQHALIPQLVAGEAPPFPAGAVLPAAGPPPAAPTFNQDALVAQFVAGDAPPFPGGDVLAAGGHPPVVTFNQHVEPQIVRGQEPPLPVGAVIEPVTPPGPTPVAPLDFGPMVPLVEAGEGPPLLPIGAVLQAAPPPPAAPTFNQHVAPQITRGQEPPFPVGDVLAAGGHPPVVTFNQHVEPQIVRGEAPPFPVGSVEAVGQFHTGLSAVLTFNQNVTPQIVAGEAPPFPVGSVMLVGQFHTGAEFAVPKAGRGFLSRPFLG